MRHSKQLSLALGVLLAILAVGIMYYLYVALERGGADEIVLESEKVIPLTTQERLLSASATELSEEEREKVIERLNMPMPTGTEAESITDENAADIR